MAPDIHWQQIALRLVLTIAAGGVLGMERSKTGHFAGLRTTLLVTLAASIAMIQMNLLMESNGKPPDSFAVMDLMRLPLGILTGVGFIGAGAILRQNELIIGITTAATLWFATVIGLCLGGGQLILGSVSTGIGFIVLWGLRRFEKQIEHYHLAELSVTVLESHLSAEELREQLEKAKFYIKSFSVSYTALDHKKHFQCEVRWPAPHGPAVPPPLVAELESRAGLVDIRWRGIGTGPN